MNLNKVLNLQCLIILAYLLISAYSYKYIYFTKIKCGGQVITRQANEIKQIKTDFIQSFNQFNSPPKMLLGFSQLSWNQFTNNENEFNLSVEEITKSSAKLIYSTTTASMSHLEQIYIIYLAFVSDEAEIQIIKLDEEDIQSMISNGSIIRQQKKQFNHLLQKKINSKRSVQCFIIGYRQQFTTTPPSDQAFSFFVEATGDFNESQFQITFTTLDQNNTLKWVNINCIEYYQYDENFQPDNFIQSIEDKKYSYQQIQSTNQYIDKIISFSIQNQFTDIQYDYQHMFFSFTGIDIFFNGNIFLGHQVDTVSYNSNSYRAVATTFIAFKMKNCHQNCQDCIEQNSCQRCKLKFTLNNNGICIQCKDNCILCNSNLYCLACEEPFYLYKGQCFIAQPKRTYCSVKSIFPP